MAEEWRKILSIYVNQYNQDEVDYRVRTDSQIVTDLDYLMKSGERKRKLEGWYRDRGASPLRCETRARLVREIENRSGEIEVELILGQKIYYEKGGARHQEERMEKQRLTLQREGDGWNVSRVFQPVPERSPAMMLPFLQEKETGYERRNGSPKPFLNHELLGGGASRSIVYRREDAVLYADRWWDSFNPEFSAFEVDCTNYISQCLFAGGAPINYTGKRESGWWYKGYVGGREAWSYSWSVANALERHLTHSNSGLRAELVDRPEQLELGDVIIYDWDGNGSYQHSTIVTAFDAGGMPLVNAHTVPSKHRYWDYRDSYAWNESTVYRFFHIADRL
ncbi:Putative amidase domain-containing protein [Fontibacillus panacisegetis]|uniref:Putative amidase domain-containing protein n=1 Tax=Fontibacillus panacisegetis TaxID=670482 RepID=A0A1G7QHR1_9BACL|nr:amidase domain-containing protein [Fontibacillus panacisegetis]SDF97998.1 Putative amidase domain-containing protein [Fontibacillus panacisegetis]